MKTRDCYPVELHLPGGVRAQYVPESRPAQYTVDGEPIAVDVTIPEDLAAAGWCWHGSFLYQPYPGREDGPGVAISTGTFPPPGWPLVASPIERKGTDDEGEPKVETFVPKTCFEAAYEMERLRAEHAAFRAAKPAKKARAPKPAPAPKAAPAAAAVAPAPAVERPAQLVMEF